LRKQKKPIKSVFKQTLINEKELKMSNSIVNTNNQLVNGTLIESSVMEFKGYARKTAENILEMGRVVYETKDKLKANKEDFEIFCSKVGFKSTSSSIKKLSQIGKGYLMMKSQADHLPNSWTTLYEISRLAESELNKYISEGVIHQNVLGSVIKTLNGSSKADEAIQEIVSTETKTETVPIRTPDGYSFTCQLKDITDVALKAQLQLIIRNLQELPVTVTITRDLESALNPTLSMAA
jgi:Fe-S cluster biosynthesis and repair protein YggX